MSTTSSDSISTQTVYRTAIGYRILLLVAVPLMVAGIGYGAFSIWQRPHAAQGAILALLAGMALAILFLLYSLVSVFKTGFIVAADRIIEQNIWPFASKELRLKEIAGFRTNEKYTTVFPNRPDLSKVKIGYTAEAYQEIGFWLASRYPDLDALEAKETKAALLADEELGGTTEERAARLALATRVSLIVNIVAGLVAAWLFFSPHPYHYAIAAGIAVPLLAAGVLFLFPKLMRINTDKNDPYASVGVALLVLGCILTVRALTDNEPLNYAAAWPVWGIASICFAVLLMVGSRHALFEHGTIRRGSAGEWLLLLMCTVAYGFGATLTGNAAFDASSPTMYPAQVLVKHSSSGKTTSYYLELGPWGPRKASDDVSISQALYTRTMPNDSVLVAVRAGRLGIPWFEIKAE